LVATGYPDRINLSWDAATEPDIAGYNVYRAEISGGPYAKINDGVVAVLNYDDYTASPGITYYYSTTAQIMAGSESRVSEEVSAMLGVEEYNHHSVISVSISPNPFNTELAIAMLPSTHCKVSFYDAKGTKVDELNCHGAAVWSPSRALPAGVYFIEITTETTRTLQKVVKIE